VFATSSAACGAALFSWGNRAFADKPRSTANFTKIGDPNFYSFTMSGTDRHFGRYSAFGEMDVPEGAGVVVLTAADGDQIVGVVGAFVEDDDRTRGHFQFSWRDSVNTGRFAKHLPPGLVVILILDAFISSIFPPASRYK
jgi:hypothetical protein